MYTIEIRRCKITHVAASSILFSVNGNYYRGVNGLEEILGLWETTSADKNAVRRNVTGNGQFGCE